MSEKLNSTRVFDDKHSKDGDFEVYLKSGLPSHQVEALLKSQNKDPKEISAFMEKFEASKKKINKLIKKFVEKIEQRYGHLDTPELMKKGLRFASKHGFTQPEKEAFIRFVLKGDTESQYLPFQELGYTEMSKFLGFSSFPGQTISVAVKDHDDLNKIASLYEQTRPFQAAIRTHLAYNTSNVSQEIITGFTYDKDKHNIHNYIHPLIFALFAHKVDALETRMLKSNIGRMVVQRTQAYFQTLPNKKFMNWSVDSYPEELKADLELAYDIARDPNSLNYFSDESPMSNLFKRFRVQVELWKNVLLLRQGQFFARGQFFPMVVAQQGNDQNCSIMPVNPDDGVSGLVSVLSSYDWTYFDSPDLYQVHDEGTMLRKLLAVFSLRPTFTQIASFVNRGSTSYSNLGPLSKATFINTPIVNVKLPNSQVATVNLKDSLNQSDWFIENKMLVPKSKSVIHSTDVLFFYVNRRLQSVNFDAVDVRFRYLSLPGNFSNSSSVNTTKLCYDDGSGTDVMSSAMTFGSDTKISWQLQSAVLVNVVGNTMAPSCSAAVINRSTATMTSEVYFYNPTMTGLPMPGQPDTKAQPVHKLDLSVNLPEGVVETRNDYILKRATVLLFVANKSI